jgi:hypothetical protein
MIKTSGQVRTIKDREEYLTVPEVMKLTKLNRFGVESCANWIGFRFNPEDNNKLFHRDDLNQFIEGHDFDLVKKFDIFLKPDYEPQSKTELVSEWLIGQVTDLCKQYCKGDTYGYQQTLKEINGCDLESQER